MEGLKILIRNLAVILLLASFLEMLLPNKSMRGFVQMVMGLFVIAAILDPLAGILNWEIDKKVPAWITDSTADMPVLAAEDDSPNQSESVVRQQYNKILVDQIELLAAKIDGINEVQAVVELEDSKGGFTDYPKVKKVIIQFSRQNSGIEPVEPVEPVNIGEIGSKETDTTADSPEALAIKKQVSAFMEIPEDIIVVQER
ncbi:stage III sporulation protein AF [Dehalobacter sp. DCM]|uniref:stage III sporulation protein AF n=1 Tax=Dehalobacter sp. DCM TaxID=2907827 RepID=UPI003081A853|nr:stage III sporulation protein AF [Dehalobacter sp. DCM]